jgi:TetR/AcrR family transcriptional repressor of nem operon
VSRSRAFDPLSLLDTALELFWMKGYGNCSMSDVVAASGVARYGIYQEFGDKNALYRAALNRYRQQALVLWDNTLKPPNGGFSEICDYFLGISASLEQGDRRGCLAAQAAIDRAQHDPQVADLVAAIVEDMRGAFGRAVSVGLARGELRVLPQDALVDFLVGLQRSLGIMVRSSTATEEINRFIEVSLAMLRP